MLGPGECAALGWATSWGRKLWGACSFPPTCKMGGLASRVKVGAGGGRGAEGQGMWGSGGREAVVVGRGRWQLFKGDIRAVLSPSPEADRGGFGGGRMEKGLLTFPSRSQQHQLWKGCVCVKSPLCSRRIRDGGGGHMLEP